MNYEAEKSEQKKLFDHYMTLACKNVGWAQTWMADAYFWGWGVDKDYRNFLVWDIRAARNGSYISQRRMFLKYLSAGDPQAAMDVFSISPFPYILPVYKHEYPAKIKVETLHPEGTLGYFRWDDDVFLERFADKDMMRFSDELEAINDNNPHFNEDYKHDLRGEVALTKAICYIFGFGVEQDFDKAMKFLVDFDSKNWGEPQRRRQYYYSFYDALHYYRCLRENNIQGSEALDKFSAEDSRGRYISSESIVNAYAVRRYIRLAFEGSIPAGAKIGYMMMESENKPDRANRRIIYHDDRNAMTYLKMAAGLVPNTRATVSAIELASDPDKRSFEWTYAYNLCTKVESELGSVTDDDDDDAPIELSKTSANLLAGILVRAYADLARGSSDEEMRRNLGSRALNLVNIWFQDGFNERTIGQIYFECFRDYGKALQCFDKYYGNKPNEYSKKCKVMMSRRR